LRGETSAAGWAAARDAGIGVVIDLRNADEVVTGALPAATLSDAGVSGADIDALRGRLAMTAP
jgi:hypothetical protein